MNGYPHRNVIVETVSDEWMLGVKMIGGIYHLDKGKLDIEDVPMTEIPFYTAKFEHRILAFLSNVCEYELMFTPLIHDIDSFTGIRCMLLRSPRGWYKLHVRIAQNDDFTYVDYVRGILESLYLEPKPLWAT